MPSSWPATLPQKIEASGYAETDNTVLVRSSMDVGPAKVRRRTTAKVTNITGSISCTKTQVATLQTFYDTTLEGGALEFTWTHPRTGASTDFRFVAPPSIGGLGPDLYTIGLSLEILP
jgi:hypothetical protein